MMDILWCVSSHSIADNLLPLEESITQHKHEQLFEAFKNFIWWFIFHCFEKQILFKSV